MNARDYAAFKLQQRDNEPCDARWQAWSGAGFALKASLHLMLNCVD